MDYHKLRIFYFCAKHQSFSKSGIKLSTSVISRHIGDLEKTLNLQLFYRTKNKISLTLAGERLYDKVEKIAEETGDIEVIFKVGDGTTAKQKQIVDDLISSGVKGIAISPVDPAGQKRMINEWSKDIKVLCVDSDAPDSDRVAYLGTDNVAA